MSSIKISSILFVLVRKPLRAMVAMRQNIESCSRAAKCAGKRPISLRGQSA